MNQPTREEFNRLEEEQRQLKEQVKRLEEQQTEPIHLTIDRRVEESPLLQRVYDISGRLQTDVAVLKTDMQGAKADIKAIRESQADFRDKLIEMKGDITSIKTTQQQILQLLQQKSGE